ncbi:MAG: hypothetical protein H0Z24_03525 [Thermosipho sp. (in: Bacteria)]|nr:hypothetical protein [Thermosipho sp. (in: thermotogales)]
MKGIKKFLADEKGAVTTVEIIGYTIILGGATALIGYGLSAAMRGLAGSVIKNIKSADPNNPGP